MAVVQTTLEIICRKLNAAFAQEDPAADDWVILSNIVDQTGQPFAGTRDKLVMCLANIYNEEILSDQRETAENKRSAVAPPLYIDLFVLFYANFADRNYPEGLGMISRTIAFFQQNPFFTHDNLPELDPIIDKLTFQLSNLDLASLGHLVEMMGMKYLPMVYYKVRMIPFVSEPT